MNDLDIFKEERQELLQCLSKHFSNPEELVYEISLKSGKFVLYCNDQYGPECAISLGDEKTIEAARKEIDLKNIDPVKLYQTYAHLLQGQAKKQDPLMAQICNFVATELLIDAQKKNFNYSFG